MRPFTKLASLVIGLSLTSLAFASSDEIDLQKRIGIFPGYKHPGDQLYIDFEFHEDWFESERVIYQSPADLRRLNAAKRQIESLLAARETDEYREKNAALREAASDVHERTRFYDKLLGLLEELEDGPSLNRQVNVLLILTDDIDHADLKTMLRRFKRDDRDSKLFDWRRAVRKHKAELQRESEKILALLEREARPIHAAQQTIAELDVREGDRVVTRETTGGTTRTIYRKERKYFIRYRLCDLEQTLGEPTWINHDTLIDTGIHAATGWTTQLDSSTGIRCRLFLGDNFLHFQPSTDGLFERDNDIYFALKISKEIAPILLVYGATYAATRFAIKFAYLSAAMAASRLTRNGSWGASTAHRLAQIIKSGEPITLAVLLGSVPAAALAHETVHRTGTLELTQSVMTKIDLSLAKSSAWYAKLAPSYWERYRKITRRDIVDGSHADFELKRGCFTLPQETTVGEFAKRLSALFSGSDVLLPFVPSYLATSLPYRFEFDENFNKIAHDESHEDDLRRELMHQPPSMSDAAGPW